MTSVNDSHRWLLLLCCFLFRKNIFFSFFSLLQLNSAYSHVPCEANFIFMSDVSGLTEFAEVFNSRHVNAAIVSDIGLSKNLPYLKF